MKEVLAGAVLELSERDEAIGLLRRTLELSWVGGEGQHKTEIRAFFARLGIPQVITRFDRRRHLEREIGAFNADCAEAIELFGAITRALKDRYGEDHCTDLQKRIDEVEEALGELETAEYEALKNGARR